MCSKNEFKTNCVVKRHHQYLDIRSVYQTISCSQSFISSQVVIMPKARRTSYNLALKLKIVAEAEAVENNSEIAREYGISESMVRRWRKDQANLFNGEIKLSAKRKTMGCFTPKYPELDQRILEWFTEQRSQGKFFVEHWFCILKQQKQDHEINQSADCRVNMSWMCDSQNYRSIMWQHCVWKILIGQFSQMSKQIQHVSHF